MKSRRGDLVLVLFSNSKVRTAKRRPALVLQRDQLASGLAQTIVAMVSAISPGRDIPAGFLWRAIHLQAAPPDCGLIPRS